MKRLRRKKKKEQNDKGTNDKPERMKESVGGEPLCEIHDCDSSSQIKDAPRLYGFLHNMHSVSYSMFGFQLVHRGKKKVSEMGCEEPLFCLFHQEEKANLLCGSSSTCSTANK